MKRVIAIILALGFLLAASGCGSVKPDEASPETGDIKPLAEAVYPEMGAFPDEMSFINSNGTLDDTYYAAHDQWQASLRRQLEQPEGYADGLDDFLTSSIQCFLSESDGENKVYSPLNVYMALGMLAEVTDGESRAQILSLLGSDSIEALRVQATALWNANYWDDGATRSVLAGSLWLNDSVNFVQETLDSLAKNYYASSYRGVMGSDAFNKALQDWLNKQTGGLLEEQAGNVTMDPNTIMALATTVYFCARWTAEFSESLTTPDVFHAESGELTCDFMHQDSTRTYYWGDKFSAVSQSLANRGAMWFLLPDEGLGVDALLSDSEAMSFLISDKSEWENSKFLLVNLSVPKFDVSSDTDLIPGLKQLGVTDVFDAGISDFTPMTKDTDEIFLSAAKHAARVTIDEEGCTAAAYTVMMACGTAMPPDEEVDFVLDRPFIFAITDNDGLPLFVGVVNTP